MPNSNQGGWLSSKARTGFKELPSNVAWVLSKAFEPAKPGSGKSGAASSASETVGLAGMKLKSGASKIMDSLVDLTDDDSVEALLRRADEASEEARSAEERAVALAEEAKAAGEEAMKVAQEASRRTQELEQEASKEASARVESAKREAAELIAEATRDAEERIRQAQRRADEDVEQEHREATAWANEMTERSQREAQAEVTVVQHNAEEAGRRAEEAIEEASRALKRASDLANEASQVAREAATEANREAERLAGQAQQRAENAEQRAAEAEEVRRRAAAIADKTTRGMTGKQGAVIPLNEDNEEHLETFTKKELLELASEVELEGAYAMNKAELIEALQEVPVSR